MPYKRREVLSIIELDFIFQRNFVFRLFSGVFGIGIKIEIRCSLGFLRSCFAGDFVESTTEMSCLCLGFFSRPLEKAEKENRRFFLENGSLLLEELIASSDGKYNPFRGYSEEEIKKATNNYHPSCVFKCNDIRGVWYKGTIEGRVVSICKTGPNETNQLKEEWRVKSFCKRAVTDVSISAMLSGHKNVLRLLGCCLETVIPIMVYEYVGNGSLYDRIHPTPKSDSQPLSWKRRLEIAGEIAYAIAYLHSAFAKPIIHAQIWPSNILVDQNYAVKLSNFSCSRIIRKRSTDGLDETMDVREFGGLLRELLTGKDHYELHNSSAGHLIKDYLSCNSIEDTVDPTFFLPEGGGGGGSEQQQLHQWEAVKELAIKCMTIPLEETTTMVEVTKQLWQIQLS